MTTPLEAAKHVLTNAFRHALVDDWIRDEEVYWTMENDGSGEHVAKGYRGSHSHISVLVDGEWVQFRGDDADQIIRLGQCGRVELN